MTGKKGSRKTNGDIFKPLKADDDSEMEINELEDLEMNEESKESVETINQDNNKDDLKLQSTNSKIDPFRSLLDSMNVNNKKKGDYDLKIFADSLKKSLETLINTNDKELTRTTDLNENNIISLAVMDSISEYYHLRSVRLFLNNYYRMRISKNRESRAELLQAIKVLNQILSMDILANGTNPSLSSGLLTFGNANNPMSTGNETIMKTKSKWKFWK